MLDLRVGGLKEYLPKDATTGARPADKSDQCNSPRTISRNWEPYTFKTVTNIWVRTGFTLSNKSNNEIKIDKLINITKFIW